jgi:hypothetical protein
MAPGSHTGPPLAVRRWTWCAAAGGSRPREAAMAPVCVFDVNETLLDPAALDPLADRLLA